MTFQNTLEFAKQLDASDALAPYRNEFHYPQVNGKDVIYFTGNSPWAATQTNPTVCGRGDEGLAGTRRGRTFLCR